MSEIVVQKGEFKYRRLSTGTWKDETSHWGAGIAAPPQYPPMSVLLEAALQAGLRIGLDSNEDVVREAVSRAAAPSAGMMRALQYARHWPQCDQEIAYHAGRGYTACSCGLEDALKALPAAPEPTVPLGGEPVPVRVRPVLQQFAELMETVLRANDHKGGWQTMSRYDLLNRLREETKELECVLDITHFDGSQRFPVPSLAHVAREAADVANFAMFIADVYGDIAEARKE